MISSSFNFACWVVFHAFVVVWWLFLKLTFLKIISGTLSESPNSLDPDQDRLSVCPDLSPNCLQRLSADNSNLIRSESSMGTLGSWGSKKVRCKTKTLIRLLGCAEWFESSLYSHANLYLMLDTGSFLKLFSLLQFCAVSYHGQMERFRTGEDESGW